MEQIKCSETSAFNNQTPGNYPKDYTQYSKHGESLKSRINFVKSVEDRVADIGKPPQKALLCRNQAAFRSAVVQHPDTNTDCVLLRLRKAEGDLASKHVRCVSGTIYIPLKLPPFTRTGKVIGETLIILLQNVKIPPPPTFFCPLPRLFVFLTLKHVKKIVMP